MKQEDYDTICDKLYAIRDDVSHNNLIHALLLARELYEMLLVKIADKQDIDCKLNCEVEDDRV